MEKRLDRLEEKMDQVIDKQVELAVHTAENTASLKEHMQQTIEVRKQTQILGDMFMALKEDIDNKFQIASQQNEQRVKPIEQFIYGVKVIGWFVGVMSTAFLLLDKLGILKLLFKI